jgi:hypothetical protein
MEQNRLPPEPIPEPKYRCSGSLPEVGALCPALLTRRGYCPACYKRWATRRREHRRAYARARRAGLTPPKLGQRAYKAAATTGGRERLRLAAVMAYGGACGSCGSTAFGQLGLTIIPAPPDGAPAAAHRGGAPFYAKLAAAGFPRAGIIGGRRHAIAVRCKACARHPGPSSRPRSPTSDPIRQERP